MMIQRKVILVDNNSADVALATQVFKAVPLPLEVIHLRDGESLTNYVRQNPLGNVALVLISLNLHGQPSTLDILKSFYTDQHYKKLPIIVFSTSKNKEDILSCYEYGANAYVHKPLDQSDYEKVIQNIAHFWGDVNVLPTYDYENA
ncbi:MAG: response regulator [Bacteroidota bacterium]